MATILEGHQGRSDVHILDPFKVELRPENRGRAFLPSDDDVRKMAVSIFTEGQLQPGVGIKEGNVVVLIAGATRCEAVRLIRTGFTHTNPEGEDVTIHDPEFGYKLTLTRSNGEESLRKTIAENLNVVGTSPIDDAHNQRNLRERYGYTESQIAALYGVATSTVSRYSRLLDLDDTSRRLVHHGKLAVDTALTILDIADPAERERLLDEAKAGAKITAAQVRSVVRDAILAAAEAKAGDDTPVDPKAKPPKTPKLKRSRADLVTFLALPDPDAPELRALITALRDWLDGTISDTAFRRTLTAADKACRRPAKAPADDECLECGADLSRGRHLPECSDGAGK